MRTAKTKTPMAPSKRAARRGVTAKLTKKQAQDLQAVQANPDEGGYPGLRAMFAKHGHVA